MTSKVVEGTWIQAQVVQGWMGQYTAQQTAGTSNKENAEQDWSEMLFSYLI